MLKLSDALSGWAPAEGRRDPLALLEAGWADIVGEQVARNSHPTRIADGMLTITVRSNAWSHQLSLLGEHVLRAVAARVPKAEVKQLRFRVGRLPQTQSGAQARAPVTRHRSPRGAAPSQATSAAEALVQFREEVDASARAKRSEGWKACAGCGALVPPESSQRCAACVNAGRRRRAEATARLLFEAPWLGYGGTAALVEGLQKEEYETVRTQLLSRWWGTLVQARAAKRLSRDGRERLVASSYVLLRSNVPPEEIMPATVRNVLGDELHDLIYTEQRNK
jgi:Dna[CI] antecedent, DciA